MKVVYICGYDGNECKKYRVKLDEEGNVKPQKIECTMAVCNRCGFMGNPWARIEIVKEVDI